MIKQSLVLDRSIFTLKNLFQLVMKLVKVTDRVPMRSTVVPI